MAQHQPDVGDEFDAAKVIVETLKRLERAQQERALRFASEALGLKAASPPVEPRPVTNVGATPPPQPSPGRVTNIKQFTQIKSPKSDQQFAAVVAYYRQFEAPPSERRATINAEVLADAARLVNRKRPTRHVLNNAKNSGYLDSVGGGEFKINTVGENLVAMALPGNAGEGGHVAKKTRKSSRKKAAKKTKR